MIILLFDKTMSRPTSLRADGQEVVTFWSRIALVIVTPCRFDVPSNPVLGCLGPKVVPVQTSHRARGAHYQIVLNIGKLHEWRASISQTS